VIAGYYRATALFDAGGPNEFELEGFSETKSIFLARYAPDGDFDWAVRAFGEESGAAEVRGIATLSDDSLVVTGWFESTVTFGAGEPTQTTLYAAGGPGNPNGFLARYGADGAFVWARRFGSDGSAVGNGVSAGGQSEIYATGYFGAIITFGSGGSESIQVSSDGAWDAFVVRYAPDGAPIWATAGRGGYNVVGRGAAAMPGGGVFTTGYFRHAVTFGQGGPSETTLDGQGWRDVFSASFDESGQLDWAAVAGGPAGDSETDVGRACAAVGSGGGLVTGWFSGVAEFGAEDDPGAVDLVSGGTKDAFVARYDAEGSLVWARQIGGPGEDRGYGVAPLDDGTLLVTGTLRGTATFEEEDELAPEITLESHGHSDIFLARYVL
jgi:hypothetical protein